MRPMAKNNIAFFRRRRNFSQTRLSEMTDIPVSIISRIESGETAKFEKHRIKLAAALSVNPDDLDGDEVDTTTVPIVGFIKNKYYVKDAPAGEEDEVALMPGLPQTSKALRIRTTDLTPYYFLNDILYFDGVPQTNDKLFLDRRCMVEQDTKQRGNKLICWVTAGSKPGRYMLHPYGGAVIIDAKLIAAHPILQVISA